MGRRKGPKVLGQKEFDIVYLVHFGFKNDQIGKMLGTTENVIKNYLRVVYDKLGLHNRIELTLWYFANEDLVTQELYDEST